MRTIRVLLVLVVTSAAFAVIWSSETERYLRNGDPCPKPRYVRFEDGSQFLTLTGQLMARHRSGESRPVKQAQLLYWKYRKNPKAQPKQLEIRDDGSFEVEVGLSWSRQETCEQGKVVVVEIVRPEQFLIRAPGCKDATFEAGEDWSPRVIELSCR